LTANEAAFIRGGVTLSDTGDLVKSIGF